MRKAIPHPAPGESIAKVSRFAKLAKQFEDDGLGQAAETLREVRAVPTIFVQLDQVLGVGGWPTDRYQLIHGESNGGKSELAIGLMLSFLMRDHGALFIDAEHTTPIDWTRKLMGPYVDHPGFRVLYPTSYEDTVDKVQAWAERIGNEKATGRLDADTTGICVVDSIRKLMPKRLLERLLKEGADLGDDEAADTSGRFKKSPRGIDGYGGRAAQYKAALNAQWGDQLTPMLFQTGTCLVVIAREYEAPQKPGMHFGNTDDVKVGGGEAIYYESSVVGRVTDGGSINDPDSKLMLSMRHNVQIRKTKIGEKLVKFPTVNFHTSTGASNPFGFDRARDLIELATQLGSVNQDGPNYSTPDGAVFGRSLEKAVRALTEDAGLFAAVDTATRALFMPEPGKAASAPVPINRKRVAAKKVAKKAAKKRGRR